MMYAVGYQDAARALLDAGFSLPNEAAAAWARGHAGSQITGIDETTRAEVAAIIAAAEADPTITADEVGVIAAAEADPTITADEVGVQIGDLFSGYASWRADMIARTEVTLASAGGAVQGFRDTGVEYVEISDGEEFDEECAAADGAIWTLDDYAANPISHPNCSRSASALDSADVNPDDVSSPE
jgi:hypothetical protein